MPKTLQLLKQVRNATSSIAGATDNPEYKALLAGTEAALNELMLQDDPAFYLGHIARGKELVEQGTQLFIKLGIATPAMPAALRDDLTAEMRNDVLGDEITRLQRCLVPIVELLDEGRSVAEKAFLVEISDWEASLLLHQMEDVAGSGVVTRRITAGALQTYLQRKFPEWKNLRVSKFVSLDGGFSKKTILFETEDSVNGGQAMVIRAEQPVTLLPYEGSDVTKEYQTIRLMQREGMPVAEPLWLEDDASQLGTRFIVSHRVTGKTFGGNLGSSEALSGRQLESIFDWLVRMHSIRLDAGDALANSGHLREWLPFATVSQALRYLVNEYIDRQLERANIRVTPQMMRGIAWLRANVPEVDEPPVIVHIDYALNNLMLDEQGVTAILDWESSRFGDPAEDIVWTQDNLRDYISMPDMLQRYRAATGRDVSEFRLAYARVSRLVTNLIVFQRCLESIDRDDETNINLCILGFKYPGYFASRLTGLIDAAEKAREGKLH